MSASTPNVWVNALVAGACVAAIFGSLWMWVRERRPPGGGRRL
jgi:hypothetical protein